MILLTICAAAPVVVFSWYRYADSRQRALRAFDACKAESGKLLRQLTERE